jgi:hypothetical protein
MAWNTERPTPPATDPADAKSAEREPALPGEQELFRRI